MSSTLPPAPAPASAPASAPAPASASAPASPSASPSRLRLNLGRAAVPVVMALLVFGAAGTLRWPAAWIAVPLLAAGIVGQDIYVRRRNPGLMERRSRAGRGTPAWDRALVGYGHLCTLALFAVSGYDGGRSHPAFPPPAVWLGGLALWVLGQGLVAWAMGTNAFFEGTIRLQEDVGHRVVDRGPYAILRHPGYAGLIVYYFSVPLLLGSSWGLLPAAATLLWLLPRTFAEDRFLRARLPGYAEYAKRVRWRLLPGVW